MIRMNKRDAVLRYKGPINGPCSACGDGDTALEFHDHEPLSPSYTLAEWKAQAFDYCDEWERETKSTQTEFRLMLSLMFERLRRKEREANERHL